LRFASWDPANITDQYIKPCAAKLGFNVTTEYIANTGTVSSYATKMSTEFAAGTAPDFFYGLEVDTLLWGREGFLLDQVPLRQQLNAPVSNVLPEDLWWADGHANTKLWGQSIASETVYIFYNKNTFKKAGVALPPTDIAHAWTWDQFVNVAKQLTVDRNGKHPGQAGFDAGHIVRYGLEADNQWYDILPFVYGNGGALYDSTYKHFMLNQPAAEDAIQKWADLINVDHVAPSTAATATSGVGLTLSSGNVAMWIVGNWETYFEQQASNSSAFKPTFPVGIGVLPVMKTYKTMDLGGNIVVNAKTAHPKEAMQMATCIAQNSSSLWQDGLWLPTVVNQYSGAAFAAWANTPWHPANYRSVAVAPLLQPSKYVVEQPNVQVTQFGPAWNNYIGPAIDTVMSGHQTAAQAMSSIATEVNNLFATN
jgi:multiple sugar transport system substrate-binding protein